MRLVENEKYSLQPQPGSVFSLHRDPQPCRGEKVAASGGKEREKIRWD